MEEKPLLLVDIDQSGKCTLNPEALSFLRNITENICVASVAGMYRTGKSYLLNRLMGKQHGFEIGPTVNACTKGIWIWGSPIILSNKTLILIDTEGLGSINRDQTIDMIIFSLSVLISSTFIYNSMGVIDEQALEDLSLVCKLTQHIHVKSHQGTASADTYAQYFPKFIWVLRDFSLQLVDDDGNSISSNTYLSNCLVPVEDSGEESKQKNTIRKILREFFRDKECVTFVRPVHQEKKLRNIQEVPFEELRKEFKEQINSFVENVYDTTTIKKIDGVPVNGTLLATLLEVYVDAINRDAVPTISTAWERTIDAQIKEAYKKASEIYKISIKKVKSQIPIEEIQLKSLESDSRKQGLKVIDSVPVIPALREEIEKIKHKYFEKCDQTLESILLENFSLSKSKSSNFLKDAFEVMEEKILNSEKLHWVPEEFSQLYDKAIAANYGPGVFNSLSEVYAKEGSRIIMKIISQTNKIHKGEIREMRLEIDQEHGRCEKIVQNYEELKKQFNEKMDFERKHFKEQKSLLESAIEDAKLAISGNSEEFTTIQKKLRQENLELSRQIAEINSKPPPMHVIQPDITGIKEYLQQIVKDSQQAKQDTALAELKLDYEMKITNIEKNAQRQLLEARKMSDQIVAQLKKSYDKEIRNLKDEHNTYELKMKDFASELLKRDMQIKVLNQKFRGREEERKLRNEHSDLLISVSELIIKFLKKLETGKGGDLRQEIDLLQGKKYVERASRLSRI